MTTTPFVHQVAVLGSVDLTWLNSQAELLHRKDRKYLVASDDVGALLGEMPEGTRALETDYGRWASYQSVYFDTESLDLYRSAATRRRHRHKVRARCYLDAGVTMLEVKGKARGQTTKYREPLGPQAVSLTAAIRQFAGRFEHVAPLADHLRPQLTNTYRRATLLLPGTGSRMTIDTNYRAVDTNGQSTGFTDLCVIETKSPGKPTAVDRLLWRRGYRPVTFSKYATALAALRRDLPANRWHRVLARHFAQPIIEPISPSSPLSPSSMKGASR